MTRVTIDLPHDVGAAQITVFAPDGTVLVAPQLVLPTSSAFEFEAAIPGNYTASLDTLDDDRRLWSFPVLGTSTESVQAPAQPRRPRDWLRGLAPGPVMRGGSTLESSVRRDAVYSLGLSCTGQLPDCDLPQGERQGWRPFVSDSAVKVRNAGADAGDVEVEFQRHDHLRPADGGGLLRLSFAIEATRVQHLLVPLFAGGVTIRVRTATSQHITDNKLSVLPARREVQALMQALTSSSTDVAARLWDDLSTGPANLARYAGADLDEDPWVSVAAGLMLFRLGRLSKRDTWIQSLAERHAWLPDAGILAAHQALSQDEPDIGRALSHLSQASAAGPVYFFESSRLQGDLLVALAADAPGEEQRRAAAGELALRRQRFSDQVPVGAFFSWLAADGARTSGVLDQRNTAILDRGRLESALLAAGDGKDGLTDNLFRDLAGQLADSPAGRGLRQSLFSDRERFSEDPRGLAIYYGRMGEQFRSHGQGEEARWAFAVALAVIERLARAARRRADYQRDLIVSLVKMSEVEPARRREHLSRALGIARSLQDQGLLAPADGLMVDDLTRRLDGLDGAGDAKAP
jgi:hypothetical protein